ncbi:MAG: hypothetical protein ACHQ49_10065 [Elusimicrobiota bacterium]
MKARSVIAVAVALTLRIQAGAAVVALPLAEFHSAAAPSIMPSPSALSASLGAPLSQTLSIAAPGLGAVPGPAIAPALVAAPLAAPQSSALQLQPAAFRKSDAAQYEAGAVLFDEAAYSLDDVAAEPEGLEPLHLEEPDRRVPLNHTQILSAALSPRLTPARARAVARQLKEKGFRRLGRPEAGRSMAGEADPRALKELSRVRGVSRVERPSPTQDKIYVWRKGERSVRTQPEPEDLTDHDLWAGAPTPRGTPPRSLAAIRKAAENGVTIVLPDPRPADEKTIADNERLYGARLFYAGDLPDDASIVKLKGLVLHLAPSPKAFKVVGDLTPLLGQGNLFARLDKVTESEWVRSKDSAFMARGVTGQALIEKRKGDFKERRAKVRRLVREYLSGPDAGDSAERLAEITALVEEFFRLARKEFPQGAFMKNRGDYATRESGAMVTTFSSDPGEMAAAFLSDLDEAKDALGGLPVGDPEMARRITEEAAAPTGVVYSLIASPGSILVQKKLDLEKNRRDELIEFRVDVLAGHIVNSRFRYGLDYRPDEEAEARKLVGNFLATLPEKEKYFSGGFDVAKRRDGRYTIIETNPGTNSSFLDAGMNPRLGNAALSALLGRPTPLMRKFEAVYKAGIERQAEFLKNLTDSEDDEKASVREMEAYEAMEWFRERYVQDWRKAGGGRPAARETMEKLKRLSELSGHGQDETFTDIVASVASYFRRQGVRL